MTLRDSRSCNSAARNLQSPVLRFESAVSTLSRKVVNVAGDLVVGRERIVVAWPRRIGPVHARVRAHRFEPHLVAGSLRRGRFARSLSCPRPR